MDNCWLELKELRKTCHIGYSIKKAMYFGRITGYKYFDREWTLEVNNGDWYLPPNMLK